uniref:Glycosyl transferase family 1 n=1 Tax=Thermosporothrix sp. COM3 TaxID=2490863 RepID=A0A455ST66_9CHLR|nr:glycosyl transferase family 1 [Thermosporothrix sp. COM3]
MAKYVFFNLPAFSHIQPTLAVVEELITRGEEVIYYLPEEFRAQIETTGAVFRSYPFELFSQEQTSPFSTEYHIHDIQVRLAVLQAYMIKQCMSIVPSLVESVRAERPDCLLYDGMFLWARLIAEILQIPRIVLRASYDLTDNPYANLLRVFSSSSEMIQTLNHELAGLCERYGLPRYEVNSFTEDNPSLSIAFIPRSFLPDPAQFDGRFLFVGPSLRTRWQARHALQDAETEKQLYIALGSIYTNQAEFYRLCFAAFGDTAWHVRLSIGTQLEPEALGPAPQNFLIAPRFSQLEILARTTIFVSHGGLNSVMESLYSGVPLVIVPETSEHEAIGTRVAELGAGIKLEKASLTAECLRDAVDLVANDPSFAVRAGELQQQLQEAGGYRRAADAIMHYARH